MFPSQSVSRLLLRPVLLSPSFQRQVDHEEGKKEGPSKWRSSIKMALPETHPSLQDRWL